MQRHLEQTMALAGVIRAAVLVDDIGRSGVLADTDLQNCVKSLFVTDPVQALDIYGELGSLKKGINEMITLFSNRGNDGDVNIMRYTVSLIYLERRLANRKDMLLRLSQGIDNAKRQAEHYSITHANVVANLAGLYSDTISEVGPRIMVNGEQHHLAVPDNANRIRTLLLSGIRSAVLWRQLGGRRWHLLFRRRKYLNGAEELLKLMDRA